MLKEAVRRKFDLIAVWSIDRLGRSLQHLIETVNQLEKNGAGLRSLTEAIDTTTPGGLLIFHVFGALAQFERDLIRERTRAGLVALSLETDEADESQSSPTKNFIALAR